MAGSVIRELLVKLGVDADTAEVKAFDEAIDSAKEHLDKLTEAAAYAAAGVAALVGALVYQGLETASTAAAIEDQAAALGLSTEAYQELTYAAEKAGGSSEDVAKTLSKINVASEQAAAGTTTAVDAFAALGITADELAGASPEEVLAMVADGLQSIEDPAARAAAATAILGDDLANKMLPVLSGGAEGLAAIADEAEALGIIMDGDALDAAAAFDDQIDQLTALLGSLRNEIGLAIIPVLSELVSGFMDWVAANREAISTGIEEWVGTVGELLTEAAAALSAVNMAIGGAEGWKLLAEIVAALAGAGGLVYLVAQVVALASSLWTAVSAAALVVGGFTSLLAIGTGVGALLAYLITLWTGVALVAEDFYTYLTGGDSVIGRLIERMQEAGGGLGALGNLLSSVGAIASAVFSRFGQLWDGFIAGQTAAIGLWMQFGAAIESYVMPVLDALGPYIQDVADDLAAVAGLIGVAPGATSEAGTGTYSSSPTTASIPAPSATTASTSYAPSAAPTSSSTAAAPVSQTVTNGAITITGAGLDRDEVTELVQDILDTQARATAATFAAGEV